MKIQHVTINTDCLEQSLEFYQSIAGLTIQMDLRGTPGTNFFFTKDPNGLTIQFIDEDTERKGE